MKKMAFLMCNQEKRWLKHHNSRVFDLDHWNLVADYTQVFQNEMKDLASMRA